MRSTGTAAQRQATIRIVGQRVDLGRFFDVHHQIDVAPALANLHDQVGASCQILARSPCSASRLDARLASWAAYLKAFTSSSLPR